MAESEAANFKVKANLKGNLARKLYKEICSSFLSPQIFFDS
jgi:hypothetical protein